MRAYEGETLCGSQDLEAGVEDKLSEHQLVCTLDGCCHTPLDIHHTILVHIPAPHPSMYVNISEQPTAECFADSMASQKVT